MRTTNFNLLLIVFLSLAILSCTRYNSRIKGSGPVVSESFDMPEISGVAMSIDANVIITKGDSQQVMIKGQQNIINNIERYVTSDGIWRVGYYKPVKNHAGVTIYITCESLDYATISGSGNIETRDIFTDIGHVYAKISGSGNLLLALETQVIESEISGSGMINLQGEAEEQSINISGSGSVYGFDLKTSRTFARISGSGNSEVTANDLLDVTISGSGNVLYKGNPEISANINGSGAIINRN